VRRRGTTPVPNATVHDVRLSYAALGLLVVILGRPESAPQGYRDLQGRGLGQSATLAALRELTAAGYRHQVRRAVDHGRIVTDTVVSEEPITAEVAEDWLMGCGKLGDRAAESHARSDLRKHPVSAGGTVRDSPCHGGPWHGEPPHRTTSSKVNLKDQGSPGDTNTCAHGRPLWMRCPDCPPGEACVHGVERRYGSCVECKIESRPPTTSPLDGARLAAGEHLEREP
jgi:hypothetical protein